MMNKTVSILTLSLLLTSCFKTAAELKRERDIDSQLTQSSRIIAELTSQVSELKGGLASNSGQLEEYDHRSKTNAEVQQVNFSQTVAQLSEQVKVLIEDNKLTQSQVAALSQDVKKQQNFIKKVTGTLSTMSSTPKTGKSLLNQAHKNFEKNHLTKAMPMYERVLSENKINNSQKNHVYFNLGYIKFHKKKYEEAKVYFSKIYTKYPKSSYAPRSLLYLARTFKKQNKTDVSSALFDELIAKFPKSKQAIIAKKEMK